jgi:hypothetical protein
MTVVLLFFALAFWGAGGPAYGVPPLVLGLAAPFLWHWSIRSRDRRVREKSRADLQRWTTQLEQAKASIRGVAGQRQLIALCSQHPKLIQPTVCLLAIGQDRLDVIALRITAAPGILDRLADGGVSAMGSNLRFTLPFEDIISARGKRREIAVEGTPASDDRLVRALVGGVLAGEAGAVVGALTGTRTEAGRVVLQPGDKGGAYDRMSQGQCLVQTESGDSLVLDGLDQYLQLPELPYPMWPWRDVVHEFIVHLETAVHEWRLG